MDANSLTTLPNIDEAAAQQLAARAGISTLPQLLHALQGGSANAKGSPSIRVTGKAEVGKLLGSVLGPADAEEALKVAERMPVVDVSWHKRQQPPAMTADSAEACASQQQQQQHEEVRWQLEVTLARRGGGSSSRAGAAAPRVVAPLFPKVKEEGWWLVVGCTASLELLALKRISFGGKATVRLNFPGCTSTGRQLHSVALFLVSDCYMGLDQQYDVVLHEAAVAAAARAHASLAGRSGWGNAGGGSSAGDAGSGGVQQQGQEPAAGDAAGLSRRARRQQQMAARQQHAAGDGTAVNGDAGWDDEPACN
jgi:activating signal cointegrator complex subunit 3